MAYVCEEWFPMGHYKRQRHAGFFMEDMLKKQLDILIKNIDKDWDFTILITGGGQVRVGKSVLGMQIGAYWTYELKRLYNRVVPFNVKENFVLEGRRLIETGNYLGQTYPSSALLFDEAGADLEGRKIMSGKTQEVLDYYRECGQYNMLNILVLPEFFDLPKSIALSRSICLIDVYYSIDDKDIFQRGYFNFYSRRSKKQLYLKGKRDLNYHAHKFDFRGNFRDFYPIDETAYRELKQNALKGRERRVKTKDKDLRDIAWYILNKDYGVSNAQVIRRIKDLGNIRVPESTMRDGISTIKEDFGESPKDEIADAPLIG